MNSPLRAFGAAVCKDQRLMKLLRALEAHAHDGTEVHHVVRSELGGLEHSVTATNITDAIEVKYCGSVPKDIIIEIVGKLLERGELS
jgi:hypothetical protein